MNQALHWLASFRLRILFRSAFLLLALAVLALAVTVLQEEKQRSVDSYRSGLVKTEAQIAARLHHPAGQLALLNPGWDARAASAGRPVLLPYAAIDFDDQNKAKNAIEMAGCLAQYAHGNSLCVAIGNSPWAGGFIYVAGTFVTGPLQAHVIGDETLDGAHRLRVTAQVRDARYRWLAPFEQPADAPLRAEGVRGRFTGYVERDERNYRGARPVKEFRGWVWQAADCYPHEGTDAENCPRRAFFSLRLPIEVLRDALFQQARPQWPPPDLERFSVRVEVLPPGEDASALFDSGSEAAQVPFALDELAGLLQPGETLTLHKRGTPVEAALRLVGRDDAQELSSPLLTRLIRRLPVDTLDAPVVELEDEVTTAQGRYRLLLRGDARSVNRGLAVVATRLSWFVGAMLAAIGLAWLVIEIGLVRRIALLTRRTRGLSQSVHGDTDLARFQLADLRGRDELGLLARALDDLLRRVREDTQRARLRAEQEKDMWHAVGHEIMSPLQSLLALHRTPEDPSHRYISRMQQAVRVLYGSASPSEAFASSALALSSVDMAAFLREVAENAAATGIPDVICHAPVEPVWVRADPFPLEDVFAHILNNADRYRLAGTPIVMSLERSATTVVICIDNRGPGIAADLLDKIFEYGVSDQTDAAVADGQTQGNRGQGLFVVKTYMAKMGGAVRASNTPDGVSFRLEFPGSTAPGEVE